MLKTTMILKMQSYWAVGSGKGGGNEVDNRIDRDSDGNTSYSFVNDIFGSSEENEGYKRTSTKSGRIYISDARLSSGLRSALLEEKNVAAKDNITRNIYSTAIDEKNGTADKGSLRGYEVAVPMELHATLECDCDKTVFDCIKTAASKLVYAVGSHKSRGLGEVVIEFKDEA